MGSTLAHGQSLCSGDGQSAPIALLERFTNADCATCWQDAATPAASPGALTLDWIVPGSQGDDAPMSAAASRDALQRLTSLSRPRPPRQSSVKSKVTGWPGASLRVAHGVAVGDYVGASITLTLANNAAFESPLHAWLLLVEALPVGTEQSPVPRNLVRNALQPIWNKREMLQNSEQFSFREFRPMNIPAGAKPARLQVIGWVQDASGQTLIAAQSVCRPEPD
ncbi:MAG: hypothetical protein IPN53_05415 [Comamonadaceae bacterium]|nr:hypothetical protein [Comamonadaceae bacterium]